MSDILLSSGKLAINMTHASKSCIKELLSNDVQEEMCGDVFVVINDDQLDHMYDMDIKIEFESENCCYYYHDNTGLLTNFIVV